MGQCGKCRRGLVVLNAEMKEGPIRSGCSSERKEGPREKKVGREKVRRYPVPRKDDQRPDHLMETQKRETQNVDFCFSFGERWILVSRHRKDTAGIGNAMLSLILFWPNPCLSFLPQQKPQRIGENKTQAFFFPADLVGY